MLNKCSNAILAAIKSGFFNNFIETNGIDVHQLLTGDEEGNMSMAQRLERIQVAVQTRPKYQHLKDNMLLKNLVVGKKYDSTPKTKEVDGKEV